MKSREEKAKWERINGLNIVPCANCGEDGLPDYLSDSDDDHEFTEILVRLHDADCRLDGELLCDECTQEVGRRMMNIEESTTRRFQHYRR